MEKPHPIVSKMIENDHYSKWLGIQRVEESPGHCVLRMTVRKEMLNGFGIAHGAITYALADSALAFAANSHGKHAVSVETGISHLLPVHEHDQLTATTEEISLNDKIGIYHISITNEHGVEVAKFKGTVYRKKTDWELA